MFKAIAKYGSVLFLIGLLTACAGSSIYHGYLMRGQVVGVEENEVVICIGSQDGARKGQTLTAYSIPSRTAIKEGDSNYRKEYTGKITIDSIIDDHFARATITSGKVKTNDVVELER